MYNYIFINGEVVDGSKPALLVGNSMFQHGDGTFEDMHAYGTEVKHLPLHIAKLKNDLKDLEIQIPLILFEEKNVATTITRLLNKNRIFDSARVRITINRTSDPSEPSIIIETHSIGAKKYQYNHDGFLIDVFLQIKKPLDALSHINGSNRLLYVKAQQFITNNRLNNCLILNSDDRISEAVGANIFIVRGNKIYTPSLAEGCCPNVMRDVVCSTAPTIGIDIDNQVGFNINAAMSAREIFLADAVYGIQWVMGFQEQRYYNSISKKLHEKISKLTFG